MDSAAQPTPATLDERFEHERHQLAGAAIERLPLANLLVDLFATWLLWRLHWGAAAVGWLVLSVLQQALRWQQIRRWRARPPHDLAQANRVLGRHDVLLGATRALLVMLVFLRPVAEEHYVVTMLCLGVASGAVSLSGWSTAVYRAWSALIGTVLVAGWIVRGGALGIGSALLLLVFFRMMYGHAREQLQSMRKLVGLAVQNEQLVASLRVERDRAESASQSKTRFFAAASHDLRQPLHALSINATTLSLLARRQGDPLVRELSDSINRALRHSNGLLDGLLDISRLDAGAVHPVRRDTDLAPLLASLTEEFAPVAEQAGLRWVVEAQGELIAHTDPELLACVLRNLVGNALKFTTQGEVRVTARTLPGGRIECAVTDTGPGIAADEQERVFEEFYQIDNAARDRSKGLGLGLAVVRRTCDLLGIRPHLSSTGAGGCRFELSLPPAEGAGRADAAMGEADERASLAFLSGLRVLVIDDESEILESMRGLLRQWDCDVRTAGGREEALAEVEQGFRPQVVLADYRLRGHTGLDAIAALAAITGKLPAVLVTGDTAPETIRQVQASGFPVIHKAVTGAKLVHALRRACVSAEAGSARRSE